MLQLLLRRQSGRRGFTLVELLAVILIIGILMYFLLPKIPEAIDNARVTACKKNMQEIYQGLLTFKTKFDRAPHDSGVKFFAELIASGVWEDTKKNAKTLTCPAVEYSALPGIIDLPPEEWYKPLDRVDGSFSAYAGRDCKDHPIKSFPPSGKEALVADDNDGGKMNHRTTTVVLYGNGSAETIELYDLQKNGLITEDEQILIVGPESPREDLRTLSQD